MISDVAVGSGASIEWLSAKAVVAQSAAVADRMKRFMKISLICLEHARTRARLAYQVNAANPHTLQG
ncbi:hypothetical protein GCM10022290_22750 [Sagittula marina]